MDKPDLLIQEYYPDGQMKAHVEIRMKEQQFPRFVVVLCAIACITTVITFITHFNSNHAPTSTENPARSSRENTKASSPITRIQAEHQGN